MQRMREIKYKTCPKCGGTLRVKSVEMEEKWYETIINNISVLPITGKILGFKFVCSKCGRIWERKV